MIYGFIAGAIIALLVFLFHKSSQKRRVAEVKKQEEEARQQQEKEFEQYISNITEDMAELGGEEWDSSIHRMAEQRDRAQRALDEGHADIIQIVLYDKQRGIAKVRGSEGDMYLVSGDKCSCMDFRERNLPCKHMYLLAMFRPDDSVLSENGDEFEGLTFALTGLKQAPVKKYIEERGGKVANFYWRTTAALIHTDERETQMIPHAQRLNVRILTGDELKSLFTE